MRTIYCAQPFTKRDGRFHRGHLSRFREPAAALAAARRMRRVSAGVVVFMSRGCPEAGYWTEPLLLGRFGEVPSEAIEPQAFG